MINTLTERKMEAFKNDLTLVLRKHNVRVVKHDAHWFGHAEFYFAIDGDVYDEDTIPEVMEDISHLL